MKLKILKYTPEFLKALKKLPKEQLKFLARKEKLFLEDLFHPQLKTHKLKGQLAEQYSFSISYH